jgi:hypothetical protein
LLLRIADHFTNKGEGSCLLSDMTGERNRKVVLLDGGSFEMPLLFISEILSSSCFRFS